jgi:hypothetical protein
MLSYGLKKSTLFAAGGDGSLSRNDVMNQQQQTTKEDTKTKDTEE